MISAKIINLLKRCKTAGFLFQEDFAVNYLPRLLGEGLLKFSGYKKTDPKNYRPMYVLTKKGKSEIAAFDKAAKRKK